MHLLALWGASGTSVFAGGEGGVYRYDGTSWSSIGGPDVRALWGVSDEYLVAVGSGMKYLWNGQGWSLMAHKDLRDPGTYNDVRGTSTTNIWAVGTVISHYTYWRLPYNHFALWWVTAGWPPSGCVLHGIYGAFAVGTGGTILQNWVSVASPTTSDLLGIWGTSDTDIWAVGCDGAILHYGG